MSAQIVNCLHDPLNDENRETSLNNAGWFRQFSPMSTSPQTQGV